MVVREVQAKSILSKSGIEGVNYCVNPYIGCAHSCSYCYASFMKKYTGRPEPWGEFVDVKVNAPALLLKQLKRARLGTIILSSVTDPYQPVETGYRLARGCLEALTSTPFPIHILTKSPLVLRDMDLLAGFSNISVGVTITTDNDAIRRVFEPKAPPIRERIKALGSLHANGIPTYVFIGPILPMTPEILAERVARYADSVLIDGMNYLSKTRAIYRRHGMEQWLEAGFIEHIMGRLKKAFGPKEVTFC